MPRSSPTTLRARPRMPGTSSQRLSRSSPHAGNIKTLDEDKDKADFSALHAEFHSKLVAAVQAVEAAIAECTTTEEQIAFVKNKAIPELKLRWVAERKKLHAELTKLFPHDPARVESYFRSFAKPRRKKKAEA